VAADAQTASLPYASTLCGACFDVCPVRIDIPEVLVHLRAEAVDAKRARRLPTAERVTMRLAQWTLQSPRRLRAGQRLAATSRRLIARGGAVHRLPGPLHRWTAGRDAPAPPAESFRSWWVRTHEQRRDE
jgi:L-lactate dehydrogenase complex protein LldF